MTKNTVHMIGQAHLDPVWLWTWTEGRAEALATGQSAVDRLEQFPEFQFTRGEAQVYRWIAEENPRLLARIRELVGAGRWHAVNGMVIQPDMNLPQGESFVRQFLLGKRVMRDLLGVEPRVAYCVDSFGHAATLPQILRKCGCEAYVFMRPGPHEMDLPGQAFRWTAPDGSSVLAFRISGAYGSGPQDHSGHIENALGAKPDLLADTMCFFGVGNHGGGPTVAQIENIRSIAARRAKEFNLIFSSPAAYFERALPLAGELPEAKGELYYHAVGCYAANSALKRAHRKAECALLAAERMAALAYLLVGAPAPVEQLDEHWWSLCFNQFHDILGGCTIKAGADDAIQSLGAAAQGAAEIANSAGRAIAARIDTRGRTGAGGCVVLFNPAGQDFQGYIEYEPWTEWQSWEDMGWELMDETGQAVPYQRVQADEALTNRSDAFGINRLVWRADIPAGGYRVYRFAPEQEHREPGRRCWANGTVLENERLRVEIDATSGNIRSCLDKACGLNLVGPGGWNTALALEDTSDTWSHGVTHFGVEAGRFCCTKAQVVDSGPLQASLLLERELDLPDGTRGRWTQQVILREGEKEILLRNWLNWSGRFKTVKLAFDLAAEGVRSYQHIPFGWVERPCDESERAAQFWFLGQGMLQGQAVGLAVLNDGKYSCDVSGSMLRQTVLRCPPYAYHSPPHPYGIKPRYDWLDQGEQEFTLALRPFVGDWRAAGIQQRANEINLPPLAVTQHLHGGDLAPTAGLVRISPDQVELTALKPAAEGGGTVLRLAERFGEPVQAQLDWQGQTFGLAFGPFEVKTLLLSRGRAGWRAEEVNMLERKEG